MRAPGHEESALVHRPAVDEGRGVAGDEDEDFGGVAETVIADGDPAHQIGRNVVEKDQPERQPAEQVKPQVPSGRGNHGRMHRRQSFVGTKW